MSQPMLRLASLAAGLFGFFPTGRNWVATLQTINGTFARSWSERAVGIILVAVCFFAGGVFLGEMIRSYSRGGSMQTIGALGICALLLVLTAYYCAAHIGLRYVIRNGTLSAYNSWGRFKWQESLGELQYITCTRLKGFTTMKLHWRDRTRSMALVDQLLDALNKSGDT